jgi:hypothetical protein
MHTIPPDNFAWPVSANAINSASFDSGNAYFSYRFFAAHGLAPQGFFAPHGLAAHGLTPQGFFAAHGFLATQGFIALNRNDF